LNDLAKNVILWIVIAVVLLSVFSSFGPSSRTVATVPYSTFLSYVKDGSVDEVVFDGEAIRGRRRDEPFVTYNPETSNTALIGELEENNVIISGLASPSMVTPGIGLSPPASRVRMVTGRPCAQASSRR
jgi:cell division protease FtsH